MRVLSDLHVDINDATDWKFSNEFYLIAGDVSGDWKQSADYLNQNISKGIVVIGNHLGYNHPKTEPYPKNVPIFKEDTREYQIEQFKRNLKPSITCLNNEIKVINDVAFVGCTLYSDFDLFGSESYFKAIYQVPKLINDFRYIYTCQDGLISKLNTYYCIKKFRDSLKLIDSACKKYKRVVVITHFAPSMQSVLDEYKDDIASAYFASNLEGFINKHPNIDTWIHGHVHNKCDYYLDKTHILCYPIGYTKYDDNNIDFTKELGLNIEL